MKYFKLFMQIVKIAGTIRIIVDAFIDYVKVIKKSDLPDRAIELLDYITERLADISKQLGDTDRERRLRDFIK